MYYIQYIYHSTRGCGSNDLQHRNYISTPLIYMSFIFQPCTYIYIFQCLSQTEKSHDLTIIEITFCVLTLFLLAPRCTYAIHAVTDSRHVLYRNNNLRWPQIYKHTTIHRRAVNYAHWRWHWTSISSKNVVFTFSYLCCTIFCYNDMIRCAELTIRVLCPLNVTIMSRRFSNTDQFLFPLNHL